MPDHDPSTPDPNDNVDGARRSEDAGIADQSATYENAVGKDAPASIDEGDPATKDDGSGTSETD